LKRCSCGLEYSVDEWRCLPRLGFLDLDEDDEDGEPLELRVCSTCHSTMAVAVPYAGGSAYPPPRADDG
jgi:hypothetical protein